MPASREAGIIFSCILCKKGSNAQPVRQLGHEDVVGLGIPEPLHRMAKTEIPYFLGVKFIVGPYEVENRTGIVFPP